MIGSASSELPTVTQATAYPTSGAPPQIHIKELQRGGMMGAEGRKIIFRQVASLMNERSPQAALGTLNWLLS
jgi:hypothetical protein